MNESFVGLDNKTTFEPEKMSAMVISQRHKRNLFDASGLYFYGEELSIVDETTLVGLKTGPMVQPPRGARPPRPSNSGWAA